jgi:hypothetical protein
MARCARKSRRLHDRARKISEQVGEKIGLIVTGPCRDSDDGGYHIGWTAPLDGAEGLSMMVGTAYSTVRALTDELLARPMEADERDRLKAFSADLDAAWTRMTGRAPAAHAGAS